MADQFICDTQEVRNFIGEVKGVVNRPGSVEGKLVALRPIFSNLLSNPAWLPDEFRCSPETGAMGKGIANWLLYRDTEGSLTLSALVLPPGAHTPIHDHLAWGLVGLYAGEQDEEVYEVPMPVGPDDSRADIRLAAKNHLTAGSLYELIPPSGDIHRVITTSSGPSISLHLLTNDVGCVVRHRFEPETGKVESLLTAYTNMQCEDDDPDRDPQPG